MAELQTLDDKKTIYFQLRMTEEIRESIRIAAFAERRSMNGWILKAIRQALVIKPELEIKS